MTRFYGRVSIACELSVNRFGLGTALWGVLYALLVEVGIG